MNEHKITYCSCGQIQSYPIPHRHDWTEREEAIIKHYENCLYNTRHFIRKNIDEEKVGEVIDTDVISNAFKFAQKRHADQKDDEGKSYFFYHLCVVAKAVALFTQDDNVIAAAYLHDILEDTDTIYEELKKEFGHIVADLVLEVTHEGEKNNKGYYFPRLKSKEAILIKFCDRASNISRMNGWAISRQRQYLEKSKFWVSEV